MLRVKQVMQLEKSGILVKIWDSVREAEKAGFTKSGISESIRGLRRTHKGYIWRIAPQSNPNFNATRELKEPELLKDTPRDCPLCGGKMEYYEQGQPVSREKGYICQNCEVGYFTFKSPKDLIDLDIKRG